MPNNTCALTPYYYTFTSKNIIISILRAPTRVDIIKCYSFYVQLFFLLDALCK